MGTRHLGALAAVFAALGGGASCLPADTRPPPGSILLLVTSADQPWTTTVDGWTVSVDRLLIGIGDAQLGFNCKSYAESQYLRLVDGRLPIDQKLSVLYGLGRCYFDFHVGWPSSETVLGEGVSEADRELMSGSDITMPGQRPEGFAVDFAATATRGTETKRLHWMFSRRTTYFSCMHAVPGGPSQSLELRSNETSTFHIGIRGVALFGDDANPTTAVLRFDPIAAADTIFGNRDGDVTLDELGAVSLDVARQLGPYRVGSDARGMPHSLEDYLYLVLLPWLVGFREDIACDASLGF